jgi:hypothetical protein
MTNQNQPGAPASGPLPPVYVPSAPGQETAAAH